ncbi:hypothetical protein NDU88_002670 [Pleurodeles waltl]|uniref:Uncharacterized protein n=1 Tax=Pleurodeles waltl TaxID=8319 RepID=A0AAV7VD59_PLEWA|nr:hypothetical protein NDU88_002670 [Pleurodeles waltl]
MLRVTSLGHVTGSQALRRSCMSQTLVLRHSDLASSWDISVVGDTGPVMSNPSSKARDPRRASMEILECSIVTRTLSNLSDMGICGAVSDDGVSMIVKEGSAEVEGVQGACHQWHLTLQKIVLGYCSGDEWVKRLMSAQSIKRRKAAYHCGAKRLFGESDLRRVAFENWKCGAVQAVPGEKD